LDNNRLIELAKEARDSALPYISKFKVGAALLTKSGKVITGCNIEDPSGIGITNICAERCAMVKALSEGYDEFDRIAVAGGLSEGYDEFDRIAVAGGVDELIFCTPCGVCRQYLNSFCPEIIVVFIDGNGDVRELALSDMLPYSFNEKF